MLNSQLPKGSARRLKGFKAQNSRLKLQGANFKGQPSRLNCKGQPSRLKLQGSNTPSCPRASAGLRAGDSHGVWLSKPLFADSLGVGHWELGIGSSLGVGSS